MTSNETRRKPMKSTPRCDVCNGKFGLNRHRFAQKQFCSKTRPKPVSRKEEAPAIQRDAVESACGPEGVPVAERPIALPPERLEEQGHVF
jgi:hypothetical protein